MNDFYLRKIMLDKIKAIPQYCVPQQLITELAGQFAGKGLAKDKVIAWFIKRYGVDMSEALESDPAQYESFNDFFIRKLKPELRPVDNDSASIISPVDGMVSQLGDITGGAMIQAKGRQFNAIDLLGGNVVRAEPYLDGRFATLYLSPKDYHRIHMPIDATLKNMVYLPGRLFSVSTATSRAVPKLFARNERLVVFFDTACGSMAMVLVGAMIVASMNTVWQGDIERSKSTRYWQYPNVKVENIAYKKGEEMGHFKLGSTVILLFSEKCKMTFQEELLAGTPIQFGQKIASVN